jgi:hypothetical protein
MNILSVVLGSSLCRVCTSQIFDVFLHSPFILTCFWKSLALVIIFDRLVIWLPYFMCVFLVTWLFFRYQNCHTVCGKNLYIFMAFIFYLLLVLMKGAISLYPWSVCLSVFHSVFISVITCIDIYSHALLTPTPSYQITHPLPRLLGRGISADNHSKLLLKPAWCYTYIQAHTCPTPPLHQLCIITGKG